MSVTKLLILFLRKCSPFEKHRILSPLLQEEVLRRLYEVVDQEHFFGMTGDSKKKYWGEIEENRFKIRRYMKRKNSFRPVLYGKTCETDEGTVIELRIQLSSLMKWVYGLLTLIFSLVFLKGTIDFLLSRGNFSTFLSIGIITFAFGSMIFSFKNESNRARNDLESLLHVEKETIETPYRKSY